MEMEIIEILQEIMGNQVTKDIKIGFDHSLTSKVS